MNSSVSTALEAIQKHYKVSPQDASLMLAQAALHNLREQGKCDNVVLPIVLAGDNDDADNDDADNDDDDNDDDCDKLWDD